MTIKKKPGVKLFLNNGIFLRIYTLASINNYDCKLLES